MIMFQQRSFKGDSSYIQAPDFHLESEHGLFVATTPWGSKSKSRIFTDTIVDFYLSAIRDSDSTSPFPKVPQLSDSANHLRTAAMLGNEKLYQEFNREQYTIGVETVLIAIGQNEISIIQVGQPNTYFINPENFPIPIKHTPSLNYQMNQQGESRLPNQVLGLERRFDFQTESFYAKSGNKILMISRDHISKEIYNLSSDEINIENVGRILSKNSKEPYWIGVLEL